MSELPFSAIAILKGIPCKLDYTLEIGASKLQRDFKPCGIKLYTQIST